jgi:hypothetical protein
MYEEMEVKLHAFLALYGNEWSDLGLYHFTPGEGVPGAP